MHEFTCRLYVPARDAITIRLPSDAKQRRIAKLLPLDYDALVDPSFRRLLAAFESVPQPARV